MADQTTFDRVCDIVREQAGLDDAELTAETNPATIGEFVEMVDSLLEN